MIYRQINRNCWNDKWISQDSFCYNCSFRKNLPSHFIPFAFFIPSFIFISISEDIRCHQWSNEKKVSFRLNWTSWVNTEIHREVVIFSTKLQRCKKHFKETSWNVNEGLNFLWIRRIQSPKSFALSPRSNVTNFVFWKLSKFDFFFSVVENELQTWNENLEWLFVSSEWFNGSFFFFALRKWKENPHLPHFRTNAHTYPHRRKTRL